MAIALGRPFEPLTHISHIDEALLHKRMLLDNVPRLISGHLFASVAAMFFISGVEYTSLGEGLDRVIIVHFFVFVGERGEMGAGRGVAGGDGP